MTTFNDVIADLTKENLLDEGKIVDSEKEINFNFSRPSNLLETPLSKPDFLAISENYELKLPDFSFLQPEDDSQIMDNQASSVFSDQNTTANFHTTKSRRRVSSKKGKHSNKKVKICHNCRVTLRHFRLRCPYCHKRVVGDLYYYSLWSFSAIIFIVVIWFIISVKTYN